MNLAWLVAVIEPDLLAERSHSSGPALPEAELAKAMQGRVLRSPFEEDIPDASIQAIYDIVQGDEHAVDVLVESLFTEEVVQDLAKFTALTLVACGLLSDRDDVPTCLRIIDNALSLLNEESPSIELCRALILQQRALRNNDIGEPTAPDLNEVRRLIGQLKFDSYPELTLRPNADTTSRIAVENIVDALRSAAAGFDLNTPYHDMGHAGSDLEDDQLGQYRRWLDSTYKTTLGRSMPTGYGPDLYFENLRLEVLAHRDVYRSRRELATMRIVQFMPTLPNSVAADSLRLLRLAGADSELRQLVNNLTLTGPLSPLLTEGRRIEAQRLSERSLRTGEMIVLAAAAEMMAPAEAFQALTRVLAVIRRGGPTTAPLHWHADFSKDEEAWIAAATLAGAAGTAGVLARDLLAYATSERLADISSDSVIARIIRSIDWADVDGDVRKPWLQLAAANPDSVTAAAIRHVLEVDAQVPASGNRASLSNLVESINHYLRGERHIPDDVREAAKRAALSSLTQAAKEAAAGTYTRRVVRPAEVVAVLLTQSPDDDAWSGLLEFLANPLVARSEKSRAFEILVRERPHLAPELAATYRESIVSVIAEPDRWAFDDPYRDLVFVAALNYAYAYGFVTDDVVADHLRRLASSPDVQTRLQVARSLSLLAPRSMSDWMLPKVYALSGDSDPTVRVAVARALGEICQRPDVVGDMAVERLSELLESEGVVVPLNTLAQLTTTVLTVPQIARVVTQLRNDSQSWSVRRRAAQLIS